MSNRSNGLIVSQTRNRAAIHDLEDVPFGLHGGVGRLIENAPHAAVALWRVVAVIHACPLVVAGAGAHPRGELLRETPVRRPRTCAALSGPLHRVAISNHRLISVAAGKVTFRWRDSAHNNEQKLLSLDADEFLRRFLLHLLPEAAASGFWLR